MYSAAQLFAVYEQHLGKPVTADTAKQIAEALRDRYRDDGYSRPGFRVADDGRQSGIVRIELTEANISRVRIEGSSGPHRDRLEALFRELPSDRSLRPVDIREIVSQARRLPGLDINVSTQPDSEAQGAFVLAVDSDYRPMSGSLTYTNRGTEQIGRNLVFARLTTNGLLGGNNTAGVFISSAQNRNDYSSGGAFLTTTFGDSGTTALLQGSVATVQVVSSGVLVDQDRDRFLVKLTRPLPDWDARKLSLFGAFEIDDLDVFFDGAPAREDRLRSFKGGLTMTWRNGQRQHLLSADLELGLDHFGGRLVNFNDPNDPRREDFAITRLHYVDLTSLGNRWSLRFDGYAQHAAQVLPSIKRFKVGGGRIGRGFDAAAVDGDRGLGGKAELRRRMANGLSFVDRLDVYGFYDLGAAWADDHNGRESAASTGIGLSIAGEHLAGYFEIAQPLTSADADGEKEPGLFVELTGKF